MKIVIDQAIPFIKGVFEPYADEVLYIEGGAISRNDVSDATVLITRTRTRCDANLLEGSAVKMIATATIGTDHIDSDYCSSHGIFVRNAAGCNAGGVMNYVFSALYGTAARKSIDLSGMTLGIVGVGHVGSKVEMMGRHLGFKILMCDPPREQVEGVGQFCSLDHLLANSDIVTMHVPLNNSTRKMCNADFFGKMKPGAFFINAARGEIAVDDDLINAIPKLGPVVIDTWNNEPNVNVKLLNLVDIATPHIAGYSYQGKQMGTAIAVRAVARFLQITDLYEFFPENVIGELKAVSVDFAGKNQGEIASIFQYNYPIFTDDFMFRTNPSEFERLRAEYHYRREFFI